MSSISSGSDASAQNKNVEINEAAGTEDAGAPQVIVEDVDGDDYFQEQDHGDAEEEPSTLEDELEGEEMDSEEMASDEAPPLGDLDDDIPQLEYERPVTPDEAPLDLPPAPVTPIARSPLASPLDSGSIPDDTPSMVGSQQSTPGRGPPSTRRCGPSCGPSRSGTRRRSSHRRA